eukprot:7888007-Ditylum_brightwellii.AAC.1
MKDEKRKQRKVQKRLICYSHKKGKKRTTNVVSEKEKTSNITNINDECIFDCENGMQEGWDEHESMIEERCEETDVFIVKPDTMMMRRMC